MTALVAAAARLTASCSASTSVAGANPRSANTRARSSALAAADSSSRLRARRGVPADTPAAEHSGGCATDRCHARLRAPATPYRRSPPAWPQSDRQRAPIVPRQRWTGCRRARRPREQAGSRAHVRHWPRPTRGREHRASPRSARTTPLLCTEISTETTGSALNATRMSATTTRYIDCPPRARRAKCCSSESSTRRAGTSSRCTGQPAVTGGASAGVPAPVLRDGTVLRERSGCAIGLRRTRRPPRARQPRTPE